MNLFQIIKSDKIWRKLAVFYVLLLVVNLIVNFLLIKNGGGLQKNIPYAVVLMFSPATIAILVSFFYERNLHGFGWKWQNTRLHLLSYLVPIIYITIAYGGLLLFGLAGLNMAKIKELGIIELLMIPTFGVTGALITVLGEEIGWRGFLLKQLYEKMDFSKASLITGVTWAMFHVPLLIFADYNNGQTPILYSLVCFTVAIMGANSAINYLTIKSGSIWTAVIFHTVHNSLLNDIDPLITDKGYTYYLITEFGIVLAIVIAAFGWLFWLKGKQLDQIAR